MAPHGESFPSTFSRKNTNNNNNIMMMPKPSHDHNNGLHRTFSDISLEMSKDSKDVASLAPINEVEDAKCECCGMCEECTPEYIERVRHKLCGKFVCGLCSEAVKEELERKGGNNNNNNNKEEALRAHMSACVRFNKFGRAFPVLFQAEAMKEMLKKSKMEGRRAKSFNPREKDNTTPNKAGLARSSSCIPAITRDINDLTLAN